MENSCNFTFLDCKRIKSESNSLDDTDNTMYNQNFHKIIEHTSLSSDTAEYYNKNLMAKRNTTQLKTTKNASNKCEWCDEYFPNRYTLEAHEKNQKDRFECNICNKKFSKFNLYKRHKSMHLSTDITKSMQQEIESLMPHECDQCKKRFSLASALRKHKLTHNDERRFLCNVCHKTFKYSEHFIKHQNSHTRSKTYDCDPCKKSYLCLRSLRLHQEKHHHAS